MSVRVLMLAPGCGRARPPAAARPGLLPFGAHRCSRQDVIAFGGWHMLRHFCAFTLYWFVALRVTLTLILDRRQVHNVGPTTTVVGSKHLSDVLHHGCLLRRCTFQGPCWAVGERCMGGTMGAAWGTAADPVGDSQAPTFAAKVLAKLDVPVSMLRVCELL